MIRGIDEAEALVCRTPHTMRLHATAVVVRRLRQALVLLPGDGWDAAEAALDQSRGADVDPVCKGELARAQDEVDDRHIKMQVRLVFWLRPNTSCVATHVCSTTSM